MDDLVDDFVARKAAGLERAYALWARELVSVARFATGDERSAEDCVHDALLRVWRSPNRFSGNRMMLRAYLMACVRNESLGNMRSDARRDARERKAARLSLAPDIEDAVDPVEAVRLRQALARLPGEQRDALELAYFGNKTHVEVARELGVPLGTIKSRISMAVRKLQTELSRTSA
jgi:RNA polymerase sigma factor (sigma-70 family)